MAEEEPRAWGLISAVLGNKRNKARFVRVFTEVENHGPNLGRRAPGNIFRALSEARRTSNWRRASSPCARCRRC